MTHLLLLVTGNYQPFHPAGNRETQREIVRERQRERDNYASNSSLYYYLPSLFILSFFCSSSTFRMSFEGIARINFGNQGMESNLQL